MNTQKIDFNLTFNNLYSREGLSQIDQAFIKFIEEADADLALKLRQARDKNFKEFKATESALILQLAPYLEDFISHLFTIESEVYALQSRHQHLSPLYACKRDFIRRRACKAYSPEEIGLFSGPQLKKKLEAFMEKAYTDLIFSQHVLKWLSSPAAFEKELETALQFAAWSLAQEEKSVLFSLPRKVNLNHLIEVEDAGLTEPLYQAPSCKRRLREGFSHIDPGLNFEQTLDQAHYCIYCHHQDKDSCSKGLKDKTSNAFIVNDNKVLLTGCPLEQKISEMNEAKSQGYSIGALGIIVIDNPMVAGTGHRICNECSKACIYQKQDSVDIPRIETQILEDVLNLPYGFEIYSLLTRWNPLNFKNFLLQPSSGYAVLIAGAGPAGYTLAHYLLNEGHRVVVIDGLKIEPLALSTHLIEKITDLYEPLDSRIQAGFGGVAEYGITVRWNKNYLKIIRLLLERRCHFKLYGGTRLGSALTLKQAFELGFDHIALCMGAGSPTIIPLKNNLVKGVRKASDFLMALQLSGASQKNSLANLQIQMPVAVVGGGLTAVDTATEAAAYYCVQVEKFAERYGKVGESLRDLSVEERETAQTFLHHAACLQQEREQAIKEKRLPNFQPLLNEWGGVIIAYRKSLQDSPSYRLNHEEVEKALEEGIRFLPFFTPEEVIVNQDNQAIALKGIVKGREKILPARTILIAAGTKPNAILAEEERGLPLEEGFFSAVDEEGIRRKLPAFNKALSPEFFVDHREYTGKISFFGDLHPSFNGNVVKAMASAKKGYPHITKSLHRDAPRWGSDDLFAKLDSLLQARVVSIAELAPKIIEIVVKAPLAARNFQPGQFYRLQNYASEWSMEPLALTGASVDQEAGTIAMIVLEMGGSSNLCRFLQPNQPVLLMGPTGTPTEIPSHKTVLLMGGGLGNAVLFSIGQAMRAQGSRVIYFAAYRKAQDIFKQEEIEKAADCVIWTCEEALLPVRRSQDRSFKGTIIEALRAFAQRELNLNLISLKDVDHSLVIGSDRMMAAVQQTLKTTLKAEANPNLIKMASINSPMQCMMKEICAQCLQKHIHPLTGEETYVFSCHKQDQNLDFVDFKFLSDRLSQNTLSEKLTTQWINFKRA